MKNILTENGLTEEQELEILHRRLEGIKAYKTKRIKPKPAKTVLKELMQFAIKRTF